MHPDRNPQGLVPRGFLRLNEEMETEGTQEKGTDLFIKWVMKASDIDGLTPQQIADKFALPEVPTGITSVTPPAGTRIRTGEVNPNFGSSGGGTQFQLLDHVNNGWADVTPLE